MAKPQGYECWTGPDGRVYREGSTETCAHCNKVVRKFDRNGKARDNILVRCHQCDQNMCVPCAEQMRCTPFEKKLEKIEARGRLLAAMGIE